MDFFLFFLNHWTKPETLFLLVFSFVLFLVKLPMLAGASYVVGI